VQARQVRLAEVQSGGDAALRKLTKKLDKVKLDDFKVSAEEFIEARAELTGVQVKALQTAIANVSRYHEAQLSENTSVETTPGVVCERITRPIPAVGLYVPAGTAPLPSTAIMLAVPSGIANCPTRIMCTPPRPDGKADPAVLVAAEECGIKDVYKLGGAQAVAAMAYGTESVPKVDKVFGPGNAWVTAAKTEVSSDPAGAAMDMPAGPSEVLVVADENADPRAVALDLLSQAEHGVDSQVILVTNSLELADAADAEIAAALPDLPRRDIMEQSLQHSRVIVTADISEAVAVSNYYAPEHLIMQVGNARSYLDSIENAGSIFLGPFTPESVGDYCSGTNHVLPTYGYARAYSGLSVFDFQKRMSVQELTEAGVRNLQPTVSTLARMEGLDAHARAVEVRIERLNENKKTDKP
jgi:histidinol dehydrogenase